MLMNKSNSQQKTHNSLFPSEQEFPHGFPTKKQLIWNQ